MRDGSAKKALLACEKRYWKAMKDNDVDAAVALTDFPCIVAGAQGVSSVDEPSFRKIMTSSRREIRKVSIGDDAQVRMLGDDVAIVAYRIHEEMVVNGKTTTLDAADASTWVRRDGEWRCAQHSETPMKPAKKPS